MSTEEHLQLKIHIYLTASYSKYVFLSMVDEMVDEKE